MEDGLAEVVHELENFMCGADDGSSRSEAEEPALTGNIGGAVPRRGPLPLTQT